MKTSLISNPSKFLTIVFSFLTLTIVFQSCKSDKKEAITEEVEKETVVDVLTENMDFQMADTSHLDGRHFAIKTHHHKRTLYLLTNTLKAKPSTRF